MRRSAIVHTDAGAHRDDNERAPVAPYIAGIYGSAIYAALQTLGHRFLIGMMRQRHREAADIVSRAQQDRFSDSLEHQIFDAMKQSRFAGKRGLD